MVRARVSASGKSGKSEDNNKKESSLKNMRMFYEEWSPIIESKYSKSSATADEIDTDSLLPVKSSATVDADFHGSLCYAARHQGNQVNQ